MMMHMEVNPPQVVLAEANGHIEGAENNGQVAEEKKAPQPQPTIVNPRSNKVNMRRKNLENLLTAHQNNGLIPSANALRNLMHKQNKNVASDARSSLNMMRLVFQQDLSTEIHQMLDRHARSTFQPAIDNLRRNGHIVDDDLIRELYSNIIDEAKKQIVKSPTIKIEPSENVEPSVMRQLVQADDPYNNQYNSQQYQPRIEQPVPDVKPPKPTPADVAKWNPERYQSATYFVSAHHLQAMKKMDSQPFWVYMHNSHPYCFRFSCDASDVTQLKSDKRIPQEAVKGHLLALEDCYDIVGRQFEHELHRNSFTINDQILMKVKQFVQQYYARLQQRIMGTA